MSKEELVKDILSNYSKKDIVFINKSLYNSLEEKKITVEIYESFQHYPKKTYTFYDAKEAREFFDDLMKDAIRILKICSMVAYGEPLKEYGGYFSIRLQILNGDRPRTFSIDGRSQDWINMTDEKIAEDRFSFNEKKKNQHLFLDDEGKFLSWVDSNKLL
jgi:hypothetical protein